MQIINQPKIYHFLFTGNPLQKEDMDNAYQSAIKMQEQKEETTTIRGSQIQL